MAASCRSDGATESDCAAETSDGGMTEMSDDGVLSNDEGRPGSIREAEETPCVHRGDSGPVSTRSMEGVVDTGVGKNSPVRDIPLPPHPDVASTGATGGGGGRVPVHGPGERVHDLTAGKDDLPLLRGTGLCSPLALLPLILLLLLLPASPVPS